jgi:hypothetical protein
MKKSIIIALVAAIVGLVAYFAPTVLAPLALCAGAAIAVAYVLERKQSAGLYSLANIAEGHQPAVQTFLSDAAWAGRYLLVRKGSDERHVALCGVGDIPLGIAQDNSDAAEEGIAVEKFGLHNEGALGTASGAIADGAFLVAGANGTVRTLPAAAGTYWIIGRATKAAANGEDVEFTPCFPIQRVVP